MNKKTKKEEWTKHYRDDKGVWEDTCIHGIGHENGIHGCDGCCAPLKYKINKITFSKDFKVSGGAGGGIPTTEDQILDTLIRIEKLLIKITER